MQKTSVIGIDVGTSGCRGVVLDEHNAILAEATEPLPPSRCHVKAVEQNPGDWWATLGRLMPRLLEAAPDTEVRAIVLDGTSGTVLLCDATGNPQSAALMYNDNRAAEQAKRIAAIAPRNCAAHGTGSGLAKALWLLERSELPQPRIHTQTDWLTGMLCGDFSQSDANSVLKLGYDPVARCWPEWMDKLGVPAGALPTVVPPATPLAPLSSELATRWGLESRPTVCAGTTDSTAAFIASGAAGPGEAVTSLGSTLVLKVIAEKSIFAPEFGVYSQPLGEYWLVGGGSNSGGAVLRHYFSDEQMARLSEALHPDRPTGLDYYPLLAPGERFPVNDPQLQPRLAPRPESDARFFQALLEGIAQIEKRGYQLLAELGAPYPKSVRSNGGGAANAAWTAMRGKRLGVPMLQAERTEACFGAARLALAGCRSSQYRDADSPAPDASGRIGR